ncbi:MAG: sialidase family protein, partial [Acidobacteriota bacterium]
MQIAMVTCIARIIGLALACTTAARAMADPLEVRNWSLPDTGPFAAQPGLSITADNDWLLAWVEKRDDASHALQFSRAPLTDVEPTWQAPRTIAQGRDWFVNWADTPNLIALEDGSLWAHWLRRNGKGLYDYGIALVRSNDSGTTWSAPIRIEPESASNDYGFVSMWAHARGQLGIAWLDSRQKLAPTESSAHDHNRHSGGPMMLRAAVFDSRGQRTIEWPLDASTCDCCTTSVARTARGPVVVYRGRTDGEIRDTRLVRFENGRWTAPVDVHADGWKFAGCPVNGPAVVAHGNAVWSAWYTEAQGKPSLRLAHSRDAGDTFTEPLGVAEGEGLLGRVALAIDGQLIWVTWLAERDHGANGQEIWVARIDARTSRITDRILVADVNARGRASGLPRMQARDGIARLVWTDVIDGKSQFGQSFDDFGRRFGVFNRVQVQHFVLPSHYVARNPNLPSPGLLQN